MSNVSGLGEAKCQDTDGDTFGLAQGLGAGDDGSSGGDDIVNNQKVFVADELSVGEFKDILDILVTFPTAAAGLAALEDVASHHLIIYREAGDFADPTGNFLTLVITALPLALSGQRDGYDGIDTLEEPAAQDFTSQHTTHDAANLRMILVFQLVEDRGSLGMSLIVEKGRGALYRNLSPEGLGEDVLVGVAMVAGTWQVEVALAAEHLFGDGEATVTHHTETW